MDAAGQRKAHDAGVVNNDHDDGERAEKIETRLAFAILKTRINSRQKWRREFRHGSRKQEVEIAKEEAVEVHSGLNQIEIGESMTHES